MSSRTAHALRRFGAALTIGIALGFAVTRASAQSPTDSAAVLIAQADSLIARADSILDRTKPVPTIWTITVKPEHDHSAAAYAGMISAGLVLNEWLKIDQDLCPTGKRVCFSTNYRDRWFAQDKANHFNAAYFLTTGAIKAGVAPWWAAGLTCGLAGVGFELTQGGYVSGKDIAADCIGSTAAVLMGRASNAAKAAGWFR